MENNIVVFGIIFILLIVGFNGCIEQKNDDLNNKNNDMSDQEKIIGSWIKDDGVGRYNFYDNESWSLEIIGIETGIVLEGIYTFDNNKLILTAEGYEKSPLYYDYLFINLDHLQLTYENNGYNETYYKE